MLQELKIKNYLSFKDEVTLSFETSRDDVFEDEQIFMPKEDVHLLRFLVFLGANASGKSNLLRAIDFLRNFLFQKTSDADEPTGVTPFLLDSETRNMPSTFNIKFYVDGIRFWYSLSLDRHSVYDERLYKYKSVQPTLLFSRTLIDNKSVVSFNHALKVSDMATQEIGLRCLKNMSLFAVLGMVNASIPQVDKARDALRKCIMPLIGPNNIMLQYAERKMEEDKQLKDYLLSFVHEADFNITNVNIEKRKEMIPEDIRDMLLHSNDVPEDTKKHLQEEPFMERPSAMFEHSVSNKRGTERYTLSDNQQSDGTQRTLGIEAAIREGMNGHRLIPVDEIERSLHPSLLEFILKKYLSENTESQLLATTHYDEILNWVGRSIRKDSVWFTEKQLDGSTKIYPLTSVKGLNKMRNLQKKYSEGILVDAYPHIK
jgi:AAA15 family ATPase/GTPase